jgi:hypothetical protein
MTAPSSCVLRVFTSSAFRELGAERDLLMKRIFPELRRRARVVQRGDRRRSTPDITQEESEKGKAIPALRCIKGRSTARPKTWRPTSCWCCVIADRVHRMISLDADRQ